MPNELFEGALGWLERASKTSKLRPVVDEVSLLFKEKEELERFVFWAVNEKNLSNFASRKDTLYRLDKREQFNVQFEFLRDPSKKYRIEAMCVLDGKAPLHEHKTHLFGEISVMHVSFKCDSLEEYFKSMDMLHQDGWDFFAQYVNDYGLFSYFRMQGNSIYLKPRLNLRDR